MQKLIYTNLYVGRRFWKHIKKCMRRNILKFSLDYETILIYEKNICYETCWKNQLLTNSQNWDKTKYRFTFVFLIYYHYYISYILIFINFWKNMHKIDGYLIKFYWFDKILNLQKLYTNHENQTFMFCNKFVAVW